MRQNCLMNNVLKEILKVNLKPRQVRRIGKPEAGKQRLSLVKLEAYEEKVKVMKSARFLRGSGLLIMDDLSKKRKLW